VPFLDAHIVPVEKAMRRKLAAQVAEKPGWTLLDGREERHVLYERTVDDPGYLFRRVAECAESEAEFVRLRLSCWVAGQ
jgi:hypothetical protein